MSELGVEFEVQSPASKQIPEPGEHCPNGGRRNTNRTNPVTPVNIEPWSRLFRGRPAMVVVGVLLRSRVAVIVYPSNS